MCVVPRAASREQGQAVGRMPPCACEPPSVASGGGTDIYVQMDEGSFPSRT